MNRAFGLRSQRGGGEIGDPRHFVARPGRRQQCDPMNRHRREQDGLTALCLEVSAEKPAQKRPMQADAISVRWPSAE